jgi:hypothetical protein
VANRFESKESSMTMVITFIAAGKAAANGNEQ